MIRMPRVEFARQHQKKFQNEYEYYREITKVVSVSMQW
jgi:hypothetical protein